MRARALKVAPYTTIAHEAIASPKIERPTSNFPLNIGAAGVPAIGTCEDLSNARPILRCSDALSTKGAEFMDPHFANPPKPFFEDGPRHGPSFHAVSEIFFLDHLNVLPTAIQAKKCDDDQIDTVHLPH